MKLSLSRTELRTYVARQLSTFFPDRDVASSELEQYHVHALDRLEHCFRHLRDRYYFDGTETVFNHQNTDQYAMYLYYLSNSIHRLGGDRTTASKVFALNKALHALDVYFEVELPDIFGWQHPVGTVLGRGRYANYFFAYQRCTVGANLAHVYPTIAEGVVLFGDTALIGDSHIGPNTWLSVGAKVLDTKVDGSAILIGRSPDLSIKQAKRSVVETFFLRP